MAAVVPIEYRVVGLQGVCVGIAALLATALAGHEAGMSAFLGGACIWVPNALLARRARRRIVPGAELADAAGLYLAMFVKMALTVLLLALSLRYLGPGSAGLSFFGGLVTALAAHHAALLMKDASHEGLPPPRPEPDEDDD